MNTIIKKIKELHKKGLYAKILNEIEKCDAYYMTSNLFLWKGRVLQLVEPGKLKEVEDTLIQAHNLDKNNIEVLLELGWYYFNVLDQEKKGKKYFEKAFNNMAEEILVVMKSTNIQNKQIQNKFKQISKSIKNKK